MKTSEKSEAREIINERYSTYDTSSGSDSLLPTYDSITENFEEGLEVQGYHEDLIGVKEYARNIIRHPGRKVVNYLHSLFPIVDWIAYYPFKPSWIYSDFVAGLTVAIVLVPQGMSYAQLAQLSPEYGLYSSFVGLMIYAFFATSKDVSIGPVAVMSLEVGKIIIRVQNKYGDAYTASEIATTLALLCGAITLGIGLLRIGFLIELIPLPAILAFMTGSAFNIMVGQIPGLMGFNKAVNTRQASYKVVINILKNLHKTKVDAAFGLVCLFILYAWRYLAALLYKHHPKNKLFFYLQHIRAAVVIIFATLISYLIIKSYPSGEKPPFSIIGVIKSGLGDVALFRPPAGLARDLTSELPVATIVLVLEHISISKSFGRLNDYQINPNQEFIAIGVTNLIGTFFHAYPATGSFSRTALKSKCGVRTPFAGIFGGSCVLLSIYCFTSAFYYIPKAALCAIIIHAVSDLMTPWRVTWNLLKVSPIDCGIFVVGVFVAVFSAIENGIYFAIAAAAAHVLWNLCITNGVFLGRIKVTEAVNPIIRRKGQPSSSSNDPSSVQIVSHYKWIPLPNYAENPSKVHIRYINNRLNVESPPPGVVVYRLSESFIYPNCARQADTILNEIKTKSKDCRLNREATWNNPGVLEVKNPFRGSITAIKQVAGRITSKAKREQYRIEQEEKGITDETTLRFNPDDHRPELKVLHLDFSQVSSIDTTSIQALIDLKKAITLHSGYDFEIHFSGIVNPWVIRGLVNAGFGGQSDQGRTTSSSPRETVPDEESQPDTDEPMSLIEIANKPQADVNKRRYLDVGIEEGKLKAIYDNRHPHFHFDIPSYSEFDL
ncbi:hypothetical protein FOA43_002335 [Brettanomyces nanus]|uniref:STAS domain-containing protein n=1 Tax=Eeniella nana TaxID=13502 RepID=A0A875S3P3_EENNA|nr:uncharacterized protein FOA43_002335 [Brettanomyces nanus]QPG74995.1 hypothetical protein FOA43_002335 [Brettanomyces nanus]